MREWETGFWLQLNWMSVMGPSWASMRVSALYLSSCPATSLATLGGPPGGFAPPGGAERPNSELVVSRASGL